jgi:DNA replication protein DnaC
MLTHPLLDKLQQLNYTGMKTALPEQIQRTDLNDLSFEDRLMLLLDRELTYRNSRRLQLKLRQAKLKQNASMEQIDFKNSRGLDKALILSLSSCQWVKEHQALLLTGATGTGKTYLACALAHQACLEGFSAAYVRLPRLCQEFLIAKGDGRYAKLMKQFAKIDVLILDDFGLQILNDEQCRDLLEILDDRHRLKATILTSQLPVKHWHEALGNPTLADAILDRIVHQAYKIQFTGDSLRKKSSTTIDKKFAQKEVIES